MPKHIKEYKKIVFVLIMVLLPILFFVVFEVCLRMMHFGFDLSLFKKSDLYPGYYEINKIVGKRYFAKFEETTPTNDIFLIKKPDTCYRVFVLGCSTTRGFPYQSGTMFSRILYYRLQDAFPGKRIEIVNLAFSAINSYSVADMIDEVLENKPDAILIYTGHNEYYGALGVGSVENGGNYYWLKKVHLSLVHLKTYQLMQKAIAWLSKKLITKKAPDGTLMARIVMDKKIPFGSDLFYGGVYQFEKNIEVVLKKAQYKKVPVIISELVSNLKDQKPLVSDNTKSLQNADYYYSKACDFEAIGKFDSAKSNYLRAKDYDMLRFRAPEAINAVIHELGEKYKIPVVPMISIFEKSSPNCLIGQNLILEHLHPNIDGYFIMADAFFNTMKDNGFIDKSWDTTKIKPISYYRNNWGFTVLDSLIGDLKIKMLKAGWPFKPENQRNNFKETYIPFSFEDSVAFNYVISSDEHIENLHISMAEYYSNRGLYHKAFNEYYSLIKCYPYINDLYFDATQLLIKNKEYNLALSLINSMPNKDSSYYFYYINGELLLKLNLIEKSIVNLRKSLELKPTNNDKPRILAELLSAYKIVGDSANENIILKELKKLVPEYAASDQNKKEKTDKIDFRIKELSDKATLLARQEKFDEAINVLTELLKIKESCFAYQMLGAIYLKKQDDKAYDYYLKAYQFEPKNPEVLNNLFLICLIKKDFDTAQRYLDELKVVSSDYARIQRYEQYLYKAIQGQ